MIIKEFIRLFYIWLFAIFSFALFRVYMIIQFYPKIDSSSGISAMIDTLLVGFKYDTNVILYFLIIPFIFNFIIFTHNRDMILRIIRLFFSYILISISLLLSIIGVTYFKEYNNQFNYFVFEVLYDDISAISQTIWLEYNPLITLFIYIILLFLSIKIINRLDRVDIKVLKIDNIFIKIVILLTTILLTLSALRGTINSKPAIRKWSYVTQDNFLNKMVMNPISHLKYAFKDYQDLQSSDINPYKTNNSFDIKSISKISKGNIIEMPNHIILVVMESYDSWPLQDKFDNLHISDNLKNIAKSGIYFKRFLPSAHSTMNSLASIISGLPYNGVNISVLKSINKAEPTSFFQQMERLGYDTYFFYGGYLSWQNIGNFVKNQGANHIYSAVHAGGKTKSGTWGVDDNELFELISKSLKDKKKTFSIVMTTSYHPPFTIDVSSLGYKYKSTKDYPLEYQKNKNLIDPLTLGHLWYSDKAIGDFVKKFQNSHPTTLFSFTGDHYGRRYFNNRANLYELSSVPFILYGKNINQKLLNTQKSGSHIDIFPTIFEIIAPKNENYYSFGTSLSLDNQKEFAYGYKRIITLDKTIKVSNEGMTIWDNNHTYFQPNDKLKFKELRDNYLDYMAISWDITYNGYLSNK